MIRKFARTIEKDSSAVLSDALGLVALVVILVVALHVPGSV